MTIKEKTETRTGNGYADSDGSLEWELVKSEQIVHDRWIDLQRVAYKMPDGTVFEPFYRYSRRSYVVVVAIDTEGSYICVRQYRQGIGKVTLEFPAGGIENYGETDYEKTGREENPLDAAKRELLEETGYLSDNWTHVITVPSNATLADNDAWVYLAENCRKVGSQELDDTEFLHIVRCTPDELHEQIRSGSFPQAVHIMAWALTQVPYHED